MVPKVRRLDEIPGHVCVCVCVFMKEGFKDQAPGVSKVNITIMRFKIEHFLCVLPI